MDTLTRHPGALWSHRRTVTGRAAYATRPNVAALLATRPTRPTGR